MRAQFTFISAILFSLFTNNIFAGEFSKIDITVREAIHFELKAEFSNIWNLNIENAQIGCLVVVSAYAKVPSSWGESTYEVYTCVTRNNQSTYSAYILDTNQIADQ